MSEDEARNASQWKTSSVNAQLVPSPILGSAGFSCPFHRFSFKLLYSCNLYSFPDGLSSAKMEMAKLVFEFKALTRFQT